MFKIIDTLHKLEGAAIHDIQAIMTWMKDKEPEVVNAFLIAHNITQQFVNEAKSPTGLAAEAILAKVLPASAVWYAIAIPAAQKLADLCTKVANEIPAVEAIALRYGAELAKAIEGGSKEIDWYILEYQKLYQNTAAITA